MFSWRITCLKKALMAVPLMASLDHLCSFWADRSHHEYLAFFFISTLKTRWRGLIRILVQILFAKTQHVCQCQFWDFLNKRLEMMDRQSYWYCHRQIDRYKSMIYWSAAAWSNHQRPGVNSKESSTDSAATEKIQRRRWSFEKTERQRWSWTSVHHLVDATQPDVLRLFNEYVEEDFSEFRNLLYCYR